MESFHSLIAGRETNTFFPFRKTLRGTGYHSECVLIRCFKTSGRRFNGRLEFRPERSPCLGPTRFAWVCKIGFLWRHNKFESASSLFHQNLLLPWAVQVLRHRWPRRQGKTGILACYLAWVTGTEILTSPSKVRVVSTRNRECPPDRYLVPRKRTKPNVPVCGDKRLHLWVADGGKTRIVTTFAISIALVEHLIIY